METQKTFSGTANDLLNWLRTLRADGIDLHSMYVENGEGTLAEFGIMEVTEEGTEKTYTALVIVE